MNDLSDLFDETPEEETKILMLCLPASLQSSQPL